jgi:hypothetical protein
MTVSQVATIGNALVLCKLRDEHPENMVVDVMEFSGSLFAKLNAVDSTVNILIGSKKFTEGWNRWRVSQPNIGSRNHTV